MRHVALGDLAEFVNGLAFGPSDWTGEGRPIIRIQNLNDPTKPFNRTRRDVPSRYVVNRGDLLVSWSASLGVFQWDQEEDGLVNQHIFRVVPDPNKVVKNYLRHMLADALETMKRHLQGATMKHVRRRDFLSTRIPLPPIEEQRRIAAILDRADALRGQRRASLEMFENLQRSLFVSKFGTPDLFHERWAEREIRDVATVTTGKTPPSGDTSMFRGRIPFVTPGDLDSGMPPVRHLSEVGALHSRTVEAGATLVCCIGTIGKVGRVTERAAFNQQINAIEWGEDVNPIFGYFLMRALAPKVRAAGTSTTLPLLKKSLFERLSIPVPPRDLQDEFATEVDMTRSWQERLANSDLALDELYASLQSRAFRGRL